ncbi:dimethyladenosine transferase [Janthinobacterium sp. Marseille]|uniref:Ribosomal RNA small subunit methyltransferase A n=1 Tax=Janthinobacterium sp. (strain Marseille) TaxID=375286 RepID=RSMA_JANMA|nr:16S rRNA (adenine(1518)-N(6)/adenine(1519)-N(6))-dimethyltransferase RsmA [Janthinobacterium sp. Marseille]A6SV13.1 RecName: Full=Ribosomal RNA small subunit methyltransferase A; AltName: Full=16S rRNA (adenine(1518)-N(6)/adenine(1519)-N(6))-dimethyltransferase; AltName: Full=16S rRNA dimethyladenosine transferase; AltName: Full=16S rRNA dimethylase; AltName: Full=S-adenosylmethionine-6-N', N'-adenosyl(rRNA) dimethyltransferase [Janthinobacterium sp. Marseille]ABR88294.1 dimethyladenosine tran
MKHIPRKRFGQNFLTDDTVLYNIIRAIDPQPQDTMVEIGPGLAAMTRLLLEGVQQMHVVELDRDLVERLKKSFDPKRLIIHSADALQFDFSTIPVPAGSKLRVVGNLPYNISSPLLFHLAEMAPHVQDQHFMLQKEVVERMVAEPGSKVYGRLSVMLQWRYHMELMFVVPPTAFDPPPRVESAIVRMIPLAQPLPCDQAKLEQVVLKAFSQRRKVIRNCLAGMFAESDLLEVGIDPQLRPETIPLAQYVALANRL